MVTHYEEKDMEKYQPKDISLRDWFAGMALQGELASQAYEEGFTWSGSMEDNKKISRHVYRLADEMIKLSKQTDDC